MWLKIYEQYQKKEQVTKCQSWNSFRNRHTELTVLRSASLALEKCQFVEINESECGLRSFTSQNPISLNITPWSCRLSCGIEPKRSFQVEIKVTNQCWMADYLLTTYNSVSVLTDLAFGMHSFSKLLWT